VLSKFDALSELPVPAAPDKSKDDLKRDDTGGM
jgi:hypothetical protein